MWLISCFLPYTVLYFLSFLVNIKNQKIIFINSRICIRPEVMRKSNEVDVVLPDIKT